MTSLSQFPRDRILWILANSDGRMKRSDLRRRMTMKYADLDPILGGLVKEGRINRLSTPIGKEMISIKGR